VAAVAAAGVIDARSLIVAIDWGGSKPSFDALGQCDSTAQADRLHCACQSSPGGGSGGGYLSLPAAKVEEKMRHQST
jgi:hypothetical protein